MTDPGTVPGKLHAGTNVSISPNLDCLGRMDFQVKIRGQRIEPGEIEASLDQHAGVAQSVVMMREDNPGDQRLVAYVVSRQAEVSIAELKEHLSQQLPSYMVPGAFVQLAELPLTSSGKVDRKALPAPDQSDVQQTDYVAPRTPTEEVFAEIWAEVLGLERVGVHDNFFELGGHSLLVVRLISALQRASAADVSMRMLFDAPTIAELVQKIDERPNARNSGSDTGRPNSVVDVLDEGVL